MDVNSSSRIPPWINGSEARHTDIAGSLITTKEFLSNRVEALHLIVHSRILACGIAVPYVKHCTLQWKTLPITHLRHCEGQVQQLSSGHLSSCGIASNVLAMELIVHE